MASQSKVSQLRRAGFDKSYAIPFQKAWKVRCSCCEALVLNGVACHERGCPNVPKEDEEGGEDEEDEEQGEEYERGYFLENDEDPKDEDSSFAFFDDENGKDPCDDDVNEGPIPHYSEEA